MRDERPGVLRPEAEDVDNLRVEPVARHLQGIVWVPGEHIALADPVDEPLRKVGRNIRPHACIKYHPIVPFHAFRHSLTDSS